MMAAVLLWTLCSGPLIRWAAARWPRCVFVLLRCATLLGLGLCAGLLARALGDAPAVLNLPGVCGFSVSLQADRFRALYGFIAALMWTLSSFLSGQYFAGHGHQLGRYCLYTMLSEFATLGVLYSDDLMTAFIFLEVLSFVSFPWVMHEEDAGAMRAGATYLGINVICGMISLMGLMMLYARVGTFSYADLAALRGRQDLVLPAALSMAGFAGKAGLFPLHVWLPKAHAVAPAPASALLSGVLTKAGVMGMLVIAFPLFSGVYGAGFALLCLALITMTVGAVLGVFSVNLKRTLACSSVSQIGYIMTGAAVMVLSGGENALASAGAASHMINHSLLKMTLFGAAAVIYMNAHTLSLRELRGFGRGKPFLHAAFLLGALGLAGVPGLNGYVSKTLIHEGLKEWIEEMNHHAGVAWSMKDLLEYVFLFSAGLTSAYMLKLYVCLFWQRNTDKERQKRYDALNGRYMDGFCAVALALPALALPLLGLTGNRGLIPAASWCATMLGAEPLTHPVALFSPANLLGGGITLIIGTLVYLLVVRRLLSDRQGDYVDRWPAWLDLEEALYRPLVCRWIPGALGAVAGALDTLPASRLVTRWIPGAFTAVARGLDALPASRLFTCWIPGVFVTLCRALDELTDHAALLLRSLLFTDSAVLRRERDHSATVRLAAAVRRRDSALAARLRRRQGRDPTDMRYGSAVTNTISFGLLLAAAALVAGILYVFLR